MSGKTISAISTPGAPQAIGPYSQAVAAGGLVFVSGQIPLDPATMAMVPGGIREQTEQVMKNIGTILSSVRLGFSDIVKTEVFLKDMGDFGAMNEVYASFFTGDAKPARAAVEVSRLPRNALIEIACIAYQGS
ncbi:RidA family protein [bacterium]|nr:RidA family protein [bacterium]